MVNETIYNYLKQYYNKFPVDDLKRKIISAGYSENDYNEAINALGIDLRKLQEKPALVSQNITTSASSLGGFKWMKLAAIIGIIFVCLYGLSFLLSFFNLGIFNLIPKIKTAWIFLGLYLFTILVFLVLSIFYLYGFVKMGRCGESRLLRFSSKTFIVLAIIFMLLSIGIFSYLIIKSGKGNISTIRSAVRLSPNIGMALLIFILLFLLFLFVTIILFYIGLIIVGKSFKYSKIAGILGLIYFNGGIATLVTYITYKFYSLISNPLLIFNSPNFFKDKFLIYYGISMNILFLIDSILMILALFDASGKFEFNQ